MKPQPSRVVKRQVGAQVREASCLAPARKIATRLGVVRRDTPGVGTLPGRDVMSGRSERGPQRLPMMTRRSQDDEGDERDRQETEQEVE